MESRSNDISGVPDGVLILSVEWPSYEIKFLANTCRLEICG